ncbi:uncharacterized protein LOC132943779 [Metopolophium dirhodum]|uniref:uncharacterized protein LOC132943779 n=1 Tax=Metopolophium dirhodum TaxID=44670 RepID=UPI0029905574|nr:uncharacterized protein LOC132943779 [Metopolophium dirhodum]
MYNCSHSKSQPQIESGNLVLSDNSDEIMDNEDDSDNYKTYEPPNHNRNEMNNHFEIIQSSVGSWKVHLVSNEETDSQNLNDQCIKCTSTHKTPEMNKVKKRLFMSDSCIEKKKLKSHPIVSSFDNLFQSSTKSDDVLEMESSNLNNDTEFVNFVKSSLTNLKYDLKLLSYSIDSLKTIIQSIEVNTSHISSINSEHNNVMDIQELIWPISNPTQLDVNEQLLTDTNIKKNEVRLLARLVGKSVSESVLRMMSKMFEDSFLRQYSFLGFKGKSKFYGLNSCQML